MVDEHADVSQHVLLNVPIKEESEDEIGNSPYSIGTAVQGAFREVGGVMWYDGRVTAVGNKDCSITVRFNSDGVIETYELPRDRGELRLISTIAPAASMTVPPNEQTLKKGNFVHTEGPLRKRQKRWGANGRSLSATWTCPHGWSKHKCKECIESNMRQRWPQATRDASSELTPLSASPQSLLPRATEHSIKLSTAQMDQPRIGVSSDVLKVHGSKIQRHQTFTDLSTAFPSTVGMFGSCHMPAKDKHAAAAQDRRKLPQRTRARVSSYLMESAQTEKQRPSSFRFTRTLQRMGLRAAEEQLNKTDTGHFCFDFFC